MTYEEALIILRNFLHFLVPYARANGKTVMAYKRFEAFCKAIDALEKQILQEAPTVDAVEVVRCKYCAVPHNKYTGCPKLNGLVTTPDFYCPFGERKDDAD